MAGHAARVRAEQVRVIYSHIGTAVVGNVLASLLLGVIQWNSVDHLTISAWISFVLAVTVGRVLLYAAFHRKNPPEGISAPGAVPNPAFFECLLLGTGQSVFISRRVALGEHQLCAKHG